MRMPRFSLLGFPWRIRPLGQAGPFIRPQAMVDKSLPAHLMDPVAPVLSRLSRKKGYRPNP